jgi:hypothetical protein
VDKATALKASRARSKSVFVERSTPRIEAIMQTRITHFDFVMQPF